MPIRRIIRKELRSTLNDEIRAMRSNPMESKEYKEGYIAACKFILNLESVKVQTREVHKWVTV